MWMWTYFKKQTHSPSSILSLRVNEHPSILPIMPRAAQLPNQEVARQRETNLACNITPRAHIPSSSALSDRFPLPWTCPEWENKPPGEHAGNKQTDPTTCQWYSHAFTKEEKVQWDLFNISIPSPAIRLNENTTVISEMSQNAQIYQERKLKITLETQSFLIKWSETFIL